MPFSRALALVAAVVVCFPVLALAQSHPSVVVDESDQPLPGATVSLTRDALVVATTVTGADGTFTFAGAQPDDVVEVSLSGFRTVRVAFADAARIALKLSRTLEETTVRAPASAPVAPNSPALGGGVTAETVARMPSSAQMKAKESLPLLPSVVRGPDGLLHLGGASAHDTPVVLDGFNVTDPATGLSSLNLPYEMVRDVAVVRDPMNVAYGDLLAGVTAMQSRPGSDTWRFGVQGVVPRPRFETPGFGRIEGIFPRAYASGSSGEGQTQYTTALEFDYERFAVPGVTASSGPDSIERAVTWFGRVNHQWGSGESTTIEAVVFPGASTSLGLSPRRATAATATVNATDRFIGVIHRHVSKGGALLTWRVSGLAHSMRATPNGAGPSVSTPFGWRDNWFARADRIATRLATSVAWERVVKLGTRAHEIGVTSELSSRRLRGHLADSTVHVADANGRLVRAVEFGAPVSIGAQDLPMAVAVRDLWRALPRVDIEAGARVDYSQYGGGFPSGRSGVRVALDESEATVVKAGYGSFVGALPLLVPAFARYPTRVDRSWDAETGDLLSEIEMRPHVGAIRPPRAVAATVSVERRLRPGLIAQVGLTDRRSSRIATLNVPSASGLLTADSTGSGHYRELQLAAQRSWGGGQQMFASYVLSSASGELNDFSTQLGGVDAPLLQRGGYARLASDARHRVVTWGTINLPKRFVVSPAVEWRTGFRYSALDVYQRDFAAPNDRLFPSFFAADMVVYKTVTVKQRTADLGVQLFNMTRHANPRDVYPVAGAPLFGTFTNSVGLVVRGYMLVKW